jgi:hypothetical protein
VIADARPVCEFDHCDELADYELVGRWTIFDWIEVYACLVHVPRAIRWLLLRKVDGQLCLEVEHRAIETTW